MSTSSQASSPDRQRTGFLAYCEKWDLRPAGEYLDSGVSATHVDMGQRLELQRALTDAKRKQFDFIYVEEISRAARKTLEFLAIEELFKRRNVLVVEDGDDPHAKRDAAFAFMRLIKAGLAQWETGNLGERMQRAQQVNVAQGKHRGGTLPPGLAWEWTDREAKQGRWALHEASLPLAVRTFEVFAETGCYHRTALRLNAEGHLSRAGKLLSTYAVRAILRNPTYRGKRQYLGELYEVDLPVIVPPELVAATDRRLRRLAEAPARAQHTHTTRAVFAGLLRCPECGHWLNIHYTLGQHGQAWLAYKCAGARAVPQTCGWRRIVPEMTFERELLPAIIAGLRQQAKHLQRTTAPKRQQATAQRQQAWLRDERERLLRQHQQGWIDDREAGERLSALDARLREASEQAPAPEETVTLEELRKASRVMERLWGVLEPADKRDLLQAVLEAIVPQVGNWRESRLLWR